MKLANFSLFSCGWKSNNNVWDYPTFDEIKAQDLPPFDKKPQKIFLLGKYSDILSAGDTERAYFVRFDITKQYRNNETDTK